MFTAVLIVCATIFSLLALGAWVGLVEYVAKATFGHAAVGTVVRLEPDAVYPGKQIPVVAFEAEAGPVEVRCDGIWTGRAFLRTGNSYPVRYLRDPARAVVLDMSELGQQLIGVALASALMAGFTGWAWIAASAR